MSIQLNDYENHRTDTEYEDNLISKIFIFQLVNSFAALTYVSFIKYFLGITCVKNDCIGDSAASLSTIFIVRLVTSAVVNVFVRKVRIFRVFLFFCHYFLSLILVCILIWIFFVFVIYFSKYCCYNYCCYLIS